MLEYLRQHADYLSLQTYVGNAAGDFGDFMASSMELDRRTRTAEGIIDAALSGQPFPPHSYTMLRVGTV